MSLTSEAEILAHFAEIEESIASFPRTAPPEADDDDDEIDALEKENRETAKFIPRRICTAVREAEANGIVDRRAILEKANELIDEIVRKAVISPGEGFRTSLVHKMPSFADSPAHPVIAVKDRKTLAPGIMLSFMHFMNSNGLTMPGAPQSLRELPEGLRPPRPWNRMKKPHAKSSYLARFHEPMPSEPATDLTTDVAALSQARCEVTVEFINTPYTLSMSPGFSCVTMAGAGGWKNRSPVLKYFKLEEDVHSDGFPKVRGVKSGLKDMIRHTAFDESRKLILAADRDRVKTYDWTNKARAVHTLDSGTFRGALHAADGKIMRAGKGALAVWVIDSLQTHDSAGARIGETISKADLENSWRDLDDLQKVELSKGSPPSNTLALEATTLTIGQWHPHPSQAMRMLCAAESSEDGGQFAIHDLDLQTGASVARFLGQGEVVTSFSTSADEPNTFVASCDDGYARLFDVRQPLPVLTMEATKEDRGCAGATYCTPDGVPYVFTASHHEVITLWDLRMRRPVYDLSTGNNDIVSILWDAPRKTLWAATECDRVDRMGRTFDYRKAKIPKWSFGERRGDYDSEDGNANAMQEDDEDEDWEDDDDDDDDDEDEDEDDEDEERAWPKKACHNEDYFGYAYDAGENTLYRYCFKENPDVRILPGYGQARAGDDQSMW